MQGFSLLEMVRHGWPVLSVLLIGSILSTAIIAERLVILKQARVDVRAFMEEFMRVLQRHGRAAALESFRSLNKPLPRILCGVVMMGGTRIDMERRSRHLLRAEMRLLEVRVPALGTIGSIAPFVGLLGTVIGIVKAFQTISANVGGGPELVAGGIAEALITTATGLLVAIPAIVAYNYFVTRLRRMAEEIDLAAFDVVDFLATEAREDS